MKNKRIKVIHTPVRFFPYMGGVEYSCYYICRQQIKLGCEVKVLCARTSEKEKALIDGIHIKRLKSFFKITNTNITLTLPYWLAVSDYDIVHTYMPTPWTSDLSILIAKLRNKKSVISIKNDMDKIGFIPKLITLIYLNTFFKISLSLTDKILLVNPNWKVAFKYTSKILMPFDHKIVVVTNGIDTEKFKINKSSKSKIILFVSVLSKSHTFKGLDYLLEAMTQILKKEPKASLWIVGDGELRNFYEKKVKSMGLHKNVTFFGEISQVNLIKYYEKAALLTLPSIDTEGFGNVLTEALACSTPVVATNIVGVAQDIVDFRCGFIVKPKARDELANAIVKLLSDSRLRVQMGKNGRKLVENKYKWNKVVEKINDIYLEVLK